MSARSRFRIGGRVTAVIGAAALAALAVTPVASAADDPPTGPPVGTPGAPSPYPVIASGLDNPRQLSFDGDGNLYIAESGHGGGPAAAACIPSGDDPTVQTCYGTTGGITEVTAGGHQTRVLAGLPSLAPKVPTQGGQLPAGAEAAGPSDVTVLANGDLAYTIGLGSDPANRAVLEGQGALKAPMFGTLNGARAGLPTTSVDISAFETAQNPAPPADAPDSNPNAVLVDDGGTFVVDAGGNDLLSVDADGNVSLVATFPSPSTTCPPPGPPGTPAVSSQAVPTSVVRGPDGDLYVSELTGFPFCEGGASIYRVHLSANGTGTASVYASDLTNVTDLAFGAGGTLYAVEIAQHGLLNGPIGAVVAIPPAGGDSFSDYQVVASGLFAPYGIALQGGFAYVTVGSILPTSAGGGQVIAIPIGCDFPDLPADSPFHATICSMASAGVINGYDDGTFRPAQPVSRQAFAAFLGRLHGYGTGTSNPCNTPAYPQHSRFPDVSDSNQFCVEINMLASNGVISGYSDGTFGPTKPVSRQAVAAFLWRDHQFISGDGDPVSGDAPQAATGFSDVPDSNMFSGDIAFGVAQHLINGYTDQTFRPTAPATRQAAAAFIYRLGQLEVGGSFPASGAISLPTPPAPCGPAPQTAVSSATPQSAHTSC